MRFSLAIALCLVPAATQAQRTSVPPDTIASVRSVVTALEQRIGQANFDCDYAFFAAREAKEFIFTDAAGGVTTRAQDLAGEKSCTPRKGGYVLEEITFELYGDVAVFNARATTTTVAAKGDTVVRKSRFTDVLVWRDARWQLVAGHASKILPE